MSSNFTSFYIAKRYLFSKKSLNAINFISGISMLGVFVGSAALVLILSVFNGFETIVLSMYNTFTPEIRIEPAHGKTFYTKNNFDFLKHDNRIQTYTETLQEKALIRYDKGQYIGLVKGVSDDFLKGKSFDSNMVQGTFNLKKNGLSSAVIGSVVQEYLNVNVNDDFRRLEIYSPHKGQTNAANPADDFTVKSIHPVGVFEVQQQFDEMIIVPLEFVRQLLNEEEQVSAIELNLKKDQSLEKFQADLEKKLGSNYLVKTRVQQNELLYKILNSEKWAIYLILTFVLIIAIFNIIGSLTMLVIDKKKDIAILSSIGASNTLIRNIFFTEGIMISMIGCILGMFTGLLIALTQQHFGFVKMAGENMLINAYPVTLRATDFLLVFVTVSSIAVLASAISSRLSVKNVIELKSDF